MAPLDDLFTDDVESDLFGGLVTEAQVDDHFVGMPVWTNSEILFYRTDLWEDATNMADFEAKYGYPLAPPTTWEQYRDMAEFFTRDTDGDGAIDLYGTRRLWITTSAFSRSHLPGRRSWTGRVRRTSFTRAASP